METLEIKVADKQKAQQLLTELGNRGDITSVRVVQTRQTPARKKVTPAGIDEVTLASEVSLGNDWLSPEDDHWDNVYQDLCTKKAI